MLVLKLSCLHAEQLINMYDHLHEKHFKIIIVILNSEKINIFSCLRPLTFYD